jgi:hypothetical protein
MALPQPSHQREQANEQVLDRCWTGLPAINTRWVVSASDSPHIPNPISSRPFILIRVIRLFAPSRSSSPED